MHLRRDTSSNVQRTVSTRRQSHRTARRRDSSEPARHPKHVSTSLYRLRCTPRPPAISKWKTSPASSRAPVKMAEDLLEFVRHLESENRSYAVGVQSERRRKADGGTVRNIKRYRWAGVV